MGWVGGQLEAIHDRVMTGFSVPWQQIEASNPQKPKTRVAHYFSVVNSSGSTVLKSRLISFTRSNLLPMNHPVAALIDVLHVIIIHVIPGCCNLDGRIRFQGC